MTEKRNGPLYRRLLQIRHSSISDDKVDIIYNIQHLFWMVFNAGCSVWLTPKSFSIVAIYSLRVTDI